MHKNFTCLVFEKSQAIGGKECQLFILFNYPLKGAMGGGYCGCSNIGLMII